MRVLALSALALLTAFPLRPFPSPTDCPGQMIDGKFICAGVDPESINISGHWQNEVPVEGYEPEYEDSYDGDEADYEAPTGSVDSTDSADSADSADTRSLFLYGSGLGPGTAVDTAPNTPWATRVITVTDLTQAQPNPASIHMEPDGWALLHSPTNFWIETGAPRVQTTLFNTPVTIEFIPSSVQWNYGDGATASTDTVGASWANLNQPANTTTQTSHTYTTGGTYTVHATIHYRAVVHVNGARINVNGTVQQTITSAPITTYRFSTVLTPNP